MDTSDAESTMSDSRSTASEARSSVSHASTTASDTPLPPIEGLIDVQDRSALHRENDKKSYAQILQEIQKGKKPSNQLRLDQLRALCYDLSIGVNAKDTKSNLIRRINTWVKYSYMFHPSSVHC